MHSIKAYRVIQESMFRWTLRVYYEDTDAGGIVYYANYLKYCERARTEWLRQAGINQFTMTEQTQAMFVVKSTAVDYHLPAQLDDELQITTVVEKMGRASLIFVQEVWRDGQCLVTARFKVGCVDIATVRPCAIPASVVKAVQHQVPPLLLN